MLQSSLLNHHYYLARHSIHLPLPYVYVYAEPGQANY
jgi:hypothetical protein